ncbi:MAG TPA: aminotransferase class I/II-fold pyridoxal phosphate-dependent enzyme [Phycisphaerales bacterium]|nr:aminotransferase class I/II-fold pyridoxal phosphate-dependent enzyme [Phycisphaerales bacterium]HMP38099.1 aminotransferase class I/II-fold pyridoxal phosphate-dependent enzyme [Phycisphaerales bacterium]
MTATIPSSAPSSSALFERRTAAILEQLEAGGQLKRLQLIDGPMDATIELRGYGTVACFCSNNYLGLANHPEVIEAGIAALRRYGAGTASVRFICGTFAPHLALEETIARFYGMERAYTFTSCWNANEAIFPTLCEPGDLIVSDELNHASIIDGIRLATVVKKGIHKAVYRHGELDDLRRVLRESRSRGVDGAVWVVTDGVFSMEGDIADLPGLRGVCDEFGAMLVVDDSHGTGVMGRTGRGTHEHWEMPSAQVDLLTGTLGKALGGAAGGYVVGSARAIDLLVQRGRPTLFSNALPVAVAASAQRAIEILMAEPQRVARLRENVAAVRSAIKDVGYEVLDSPTAICPIIVHDTARAIAMSNRLLDHGVFVIGFGYPVVPEGHARLRVQVSAAHAPEHIRALIDGLRAL